jgi:hypothetical protein
MLFVPALLLGGAPQRLLSLTALVAGPLATDRLVVGDERARQYEWASMWCVPCRWPKGWVCVGGCGAAVRKQQAAPNGRCWAPAAGRVQVPLLHGAGAGAGLH